MAKKDINERVTEDILPVGGMGVVEEAGIMYDPTNQAVDLSKEEKRRTTALFMAINAYQHLIIKEAEYLKEAANLARHGDGPTLQPATIDAMVIAAMKFDAFISGQMSFAETEDEEKSPETVSSSHAQAAGQASAKQMPAGEGGGNIKRELKVKEKHHERI